MNEIIINVKPGTHRDMVKTALLADGWTITGSGYNLADGIGDLWATPPAGAHHEEFHPDSRSVNLPDIDGGDPGKPTSES